MMDTPYYHKYESFKTRQLKLKSIREAGVDPYPHHYQPTHRIKELKKKCDDSTIGDSKQAMREEAENVAFGRAPCAFSVDGEKCILSAAR